MSGWTAKVGDVVVGGQPPNLRDIHTATDLLDGFIAHVFIHDVNNKWPRRVRELLVASLFRHYDEFCAILQGEPDNKYECLENHLFVSTVREKLDSAGVSQEVFDKWKSEVQTGFFNRNLPALAIQNFPRHMGEVSNPFHQVMMDPRCFVDQFNSLAAHYQGLHAQSCQQQSAIGNLTAMVHQLQCQLQNQTELLVKLFHQGTPTSVPVSPSAAGSPQQAAQQQLDFSQEEDQVTTEPFVKRFSVGYTSLPTKGCTIADHFYYFFSDRARAGYEKDKSMEMTPKERTRIRNHFVRLKRTVKLMLFFCEEYPRERPSNAQELSVWLSELRAMGALAEVQMREVLYPDEPNKNMVPSALTNKAIAEKVRLWEDPSSNSYHSLPESTPEATKDWFTCVEKKSASGLKRKNDSTN